MRKKVLSLKWLPLAWFPLIFITTVSIIIAIIPNLTSSNVGTISFDLIISSTGYLLAIIVLFYLLRKRNIGKSVIGIKGTLSFPAIGYALIGFLITFFLFPTVGLLVKTFGIEMFWQVEEAVPKPATLTLMDWVVIFIGIVIVVSITEEVIFRGYLLTAFIQRTKKIFYSIFLSALIFASAHFAIGPGMILYAFLGAFVFSLLYLKFGSLYPAILAHALTNLVGFIILPLIFCA